MIKHEFQGILFKYQMSKFQINPNGRPQSYQQYAQAHWNVRPDIQMNNNTMMHTAGQAQWSSPSPTPTPSTVPT